MRVLLKYNRGGGATEYFIKKKENKYISLDERTKLNGWLQIIVV